MSSPSPSPKSFLRQRVAIKDDDKDAIPRTPSPRIKKEEVVWGKTPNGQVFRVPTTHDVLTALFHPSYPKSHFDILNLGLLAFQLALFAVLPNSYAVAFFFVYFAFWRGAYDLGLGWVLTKQSKRRWIVREMNKKGWLDQERCPNVRLWIKKQLVGKMGKDYEFDELPLEYNTWLLFRQVVDVILINDFLSYCMFSFACFRIPSGLSLPVHIFRWVCGISLILFNLWVKTEAHNVVKDYGWYWGDVFFQRGALVFDGVFELAPHPMYSVGYAGYYGLSLICGSYKVLFVSLAAHAAQFAFLVLFENPHIERMYGQKKAIAKRTPLRQYVRQEADMEGYETPAATEGETATDSTELETETETEQEEPTRETPRQPAEEKKRALTQHDLTTKYFRRDTLVFKNFDFFRANDLMMLLIVVYSLAFALLPTSLSPSTLVALHYSHALAWTLFHTFGLGLVLRAQSDSKFLVKHYMKNYHYPHENGGSGAIVEAFGNWKAIYNMSMCMTFLSFVGVAWKTYSMNVGHEILRHTMGVLLLGLHVWASMESYEVLGAFGWFFGDFFMDSYPAHLQYSGIYRYLNNPEIMGGAAWFGLGLISGSKLVFSLAVIRSLSHWWFLSSVEQPHMRKLYGESLRKEAGFVKVIKKNLEKRPELTRVAKEVKGTFDKVYEETADAVEEFLAKSRPRITGVMQDTKVMLQQSRERLVITRVANERDFDASKYRLDIPSSSSSGGLKFRLGQPISVNWKAPKGHSRKDWIGIYRIGANKSSLVTKVASKGMWLPIYDDEWDGDVPLNGSDDKTIEDEGVVTFKGDFLPWNVGKYEIRYHHDGKYNVMSSGGPIEVFVDKPKRMDFQSVRDTLKTIVPLCLDSDPSLVPLSCQQIEDLDESATGTPTIRSIPLQASNSSDPDDFSFWSERQAKRICGAIREAFGVEYVAEVIVADANLTALARRILASKEL